jgi:hypothetical protein
MMIKLTTELRHDEKTNKPQMETNATKNEMTDAATVHRHYDGGKRLTDAATTTRMTDAAIVNIEYPTTRDDMMDAKYFM